VCDQVEDKLNKAVNRILAYKSLAKRLLKERRFKHVAELLDFAIQKNPENATLLMEKGKVQFLMMKYGEAAGIFASSLSYKDVDKVETLYNLGLSHLYLGNYAEALLHFE